ncbi:related to IMG2-mitochondrial ribosomal protein of the large subunit [Sporisorium scitamineum]|uniref:Large ribosomal subunit protein mL49 n=1 Tax=Sporisorium scitamineum TaxID=49012 RepID=A0A0F7S5P3_9BASI|nr:related to IMG2-mitochondrial ribosomal protein of the large subunit [Sporisorium scitamineum]CDW96599.1 hypothetical protein [Sporisorium scitamineum]
MTSLARTALRTALRPTTPSSTASTSPIASTSKLPHPSLTRCNSTVSTHPSSSSSEPPTADLSSDLKPSSSPTPIRYTYFVPRVGKTLSSLPVYTDIRNGGTRTLTELRKIQGSISDLKADLSLFLSETYSPNPELPHHSPFKVNKKPLRPKAGRKLVERTGNPGFLDPVQVGKVQASGKLKIRGNRVEEVKAFLESRGF